MVRKTIVNMVREREHICREERENVEHGGECEGRA